MRVENVDLRSPFEKYRRMAMRKILTANKIPFRHDAPATDLRRIAMEYGIDPMNPIPGKEAFMTKIEGSVIEEYNVPDIEEDDGYGDLHISKLRKLLGERNIKIKNTMKKAEMIERLREADGNQNAT